jgi:serine/threonine-protein kinase RsbW/non-specific serine/threonine protein kinase
MRWTDYITPSTLHLAPFVELLLGPLASVDGLVQLQLGLHEVLVNAVRHGNGCDPAKCLRVRRILTPHWPGRARSSVRYASRSAALRASRGSTCGRHGRGG